MKKLYEIKKEAMKKIIKKKKENEKKNKQKLKINSGLKIHKNNKRI